LLADLVGDFLFHYESFQAASMRAADTKAAPIYQYRLHI